MSAKKKDAEDKRKIILESIIEGKKMEAYAEHRTKEMHTCWFCDTVIYRKKPIKQIGTRWICMDCLRQLKEALDTLEQWEKELALEGEMKRQLNGGLGI